MVSALHRKSPKNRIDVHTIASIKNPCCVYYIKEKFFHLYGIKRWLNIIDKKFGDT